ncbi:hypothetical protein T4A_6850 [Trichinella pseudospiralis]|uniref:Uncharacterized protein n=1 Tax=Trichinella pseudospiralis TaxID=6337 RepID=A0A0V1FZL9_TRIPS|nr:hypothetical protein T4A_6850 [Trichinella pseudospiralis]KRY91494.1 hypothetical protein T4D_3935 [Trichinella pseudospiralis]KRZ40309.1 hypothetical protein T4C_7536 [Trichinella pseudospiralis]
MLLYTYFTVTLAQRSSALPLFSLLKLFFEKRKPREECVFFSAHLMLKINHYTYSSLLQKTNTEMEQKRN